MATRVDLLGQPRISLDDVPAAAPRGSKCWAVLACLVLTDRPVPRARLMDLLFDDADDPAAALRWSLSQLRRALGDAAQLGGDPLRWQPSADTVVDVDVVLNGLWSQALELPGFGDPLLEGIRLRVGPSFEIWLANERRRFAAQTASVLHGGAHSRLARGDTAGAVVLAERLVDAAPLDERSHELLVRTLVAAGDEEAAMARADECRSLLQRELGRLPSQALWDALRPSRPSGSRERSDVLAAIDLGAGAAYGGAYDHAIDALRQVISEVDDPDLMARALFSLGASLVHGVRGSDEEAVTVLHRAFVTATDCGAHRVAALAAIELGLVETFRAHYPRMEEWFAEARRLADGDARVLAWVGVYAGFGRTDQADYPRALATLEEADRLARSSGDLRALAYAATGLGRLRVLRGELAAARAALEVAVATVREISWTSFLPFPRALLAEVELREGNLEAAEEAIEQSYSLACRVGDPCWESYALRGRGLLAAARGDEAQALDLLLAARQPARQHLDIHEWVDGYCLDALCDFAVSRDLPAAAGWVEELEEFAAHRGMRELVARALLHRARLGQPDARDAPLLLLEMIDNPELAHLAAAAGVTV